MRAWTGTIYRLRWPVLGAWLALTVLSILAIAGAFGPSLPAQLSNRFDLPNTESNTARVILQDKFGERDDAGFTLVAKSTGGPVDQAAVRAAAARVADAVPESTAGPLQTAGDDVAYVAIGTRLDPTKAETYTGDARRAVGAVPGATTYITGQTAINKDLKPVFDKDLAKGNSIAIPIAVLVLLFIFGTLVATGMPLLFALGTIPATLGAVWVVAHVIDMAIYVTNLVELIGLAIAIDYSLLIVYRYREEFRNESDEAGRLAAWRALHDAALASGEPGLVATTSRWDSYVRVRNRWLWNIVAFFIPPVMGWVVFQLVMAWLETRSAERLVGLAREPGAALPDVAAALAAVDAAEARQRPAVLPALYTTMHTAGHAVLFSGITVAIGLALLLLMPLPFIRSMGIGGVLIPLVSIAAAMTLLPALLGVMGRAVNMGRIVPMSVIEKRNSPGVGLWARLAATIMRRPARIAITIGAVLVVAGIPTVFLSLTPGSNAGLPGNLESVKGLHVLEHKLGPGTLAPAIVVVDTGHDGGASSVMPAMRSLADRLRHDPEVATVLSPTDASADSGFFVDPSGRYVRMTVATTHDYGTDPAKKFAHRLRDTYVPETDFGSARVYAGGGPPTGIDFIDRAFSVFPWLVLGVLVVTYLVLVRAFRSVVLPLKAVLLNVLSILATYGLLVVTFRWGAGSSAFQQNDQVEAWIPIFLFAMLFGLSMDYEVFLLSRMREIYDDTHDNVQAVTLGLEKTGRIVTAAAAIMVAAFSGFLFGHLVGLQEFGWGLASAIFIDATIIRALMVPAIMALLGDWNWYMPHWTARLLRVEGFRPRGAQTEAGD